MLLFHSPENQVANCLPSDGIVVDHGVIFSKEEAAQFLATLLTTLPWEQDELTIFGRKILTQRKTAWYGDLPCAYTYSHVIQERLAFGRVEQK
ncbi:MAG: hypothetical protein IPP17_16735 [Bacteroidetes bacterium]|nr:hypothetical protein [Bacteroidota bacterium]